MRYILLFITIIFSNQLFGQSKIFKDYNFEDGGYAIFLIDEDSYRFGSNLFSDNTKKVIISNRNHYIIDSLETLRFIQNNWIGEEIFYFDNICSDYKFYLTRYDSLIAEGRVSVNKYFSELIFDNKKYKFDTTFFRNNLLSGDTLYQFRYNYSSDRQKALNEYQNIHNGYLIFLNEKEPDWVKFEGYFEIEYHNKEEKFKNEVQEIIENKINNLYPTNDFKIHETTLSALGKYGTNHYRYIIDCEYELYKKLNVFDITKEWVYYKDFYEILFCREIPNH